MRTVRCTDFAQRGCNFTVTGSRPEDLKQAMILHTEVRHPEKLKAITPAMLEAVRREMDVLFI